LHAWLIEQQDTVLPKSPIGQAINYALNHWQALTRYLDDGDLEPFNELPSTFRHSRAGGSPVELACAY
jgi:hypothetical protein